MDSFGLLRRRYFRRARIQSTGRIRVPPGSKSTSCCLLGDAPPGSLTLCFPGAPEGRCCASDQPNGVPRLSGAIFRDSPVYTCVKYVVICQGRSDAFNVVLKGRGLKIGAKPT